MNALIYFTLCLISLLTVPLKGQTITIDLPVSRMVFQRSLDNSALVPVRGRVLAQANRVKGRLVARQGGQTTEWREGTVQNGVYQITIPAVGGFYDLELITLAGNTELERQRRERIGVGEVFVVSGQSNNFGEPGLGLPATDDRVSVVNQRQSNANYFDEKALPMAFAQAGAGTNCGPVNPLYIWGGLGDRLVAKLGVPVLFLGAAHQGSSTQNWREAAQGVDRVGGRDWFNNVPYRPLRSTLHYYTSQTGVRGILWHQGESDNMYQTTDGYVDNMRILINKTREDSKFSNLSWMIARASYYPFYPGHERDPGIIAGQNRVIQSTSNCFPGPSTDDYIGTAYRRDQIHFADYAYSFLADLWNQSLTTDYFQRAQPSLPAIGQASPVAGSENLSSATPSVPVSPTNPPATTGAFQLGNPAYNCQTGAITFGTGGGNGSPVEFMVPGVTGWTTNPTHTLGDGVRRDAQTIAIWARQSGQETSLTWNIRGFCDGSAPNPAPQIPVPTPTVNTPSAPVQSGNKTDGGFTPLSPSYNCQTGAITFMASRGNGSLVEFMVPGVTGWTTNASHVLGEGIRRDAQWLLISARQSGVDVTLNWNLRGTCDGSVPTQPVINAQTPATQPQTPATQSGMLALAPPGYDCQTGTLVLKTAGGNGSLVEFMAPGITGWTTNATHVLEAGVRRDAQTIAIWARQSGQETSLTWNLRGACSGAGGARARVAQVGASDIRLMVMPNPTTDEVQLLWPDITKLNWKSRFASASGLDMPVTILPNQEGLQANIRHLSTGVYLWQVAVPGRPSLTFRIMKVE